MTLSSIASYKGKLLRDMDKEELLQVIEAQIKEFRTVQPHVNWDGWRIKNLPALHVATDD